MQDQAVKRQFSSRLCERMKKQIGDSFHLI